MVKKKNKKIFILTLFIYQICAAAEKPSQVDIDAFYARQRKEKNEFTKNAQQEIEDCKQQYKKWFKPHDPDAEKFFACKHSVDEKLIKYSRSQSLEACAKLQVSCN